MIFIMILSIFRWTNISLVVAFLMMLVVAAATLETPMNVLLVYIFDEAEIFRIELLELDREFGRGADLLQPIQVL